MHTNQQSEMPFAAEDFLSLVKERHAVRNFDPNYQISQQQLRELLKLASSAPSAWNLQHWKFLVITEQLDKERLFPIADQQQHVLDASAMIAVLGDLEPWRNVESAYMPLVRERLMSESSYHRLADQLERIYATPRLARDHAYLNASLAAMQVMLAAKSIGLNTCPMGGFDAERLVDAFAIPSRYTPIMLIAVGRATAPARPTIRIPIDEQIVWDKFD